MRLKCLVPAIILFGLLPSIKPAICGDELPLGYYTPRAPSNPAHRDSLRDDLGANVVTLGYDSNVNNINGLAADGIKSIPSLAYMTGLNNLYLSACYSVWEAEDDVSEIRFLVKVGSYTTIGSDTFWVAPEWSDSVLTDTAFLDNLWYRQWHRKDVSGQPLPFQPVLRIWADVDSSLQGDTLGYLRIYEVKDWWFTDSLSLHRYPLKIYPIEADVFLADTTTHLIDYVFNPYLKDDSGSVINYQITTTGKCAMMIDYLKISNSYGRNMIDQREYDGDIKNTVTQAWGDTTKLFAWELRDEPLPDQFLPYRQADSLIQDTTYDEFGSSLFGMTAYNWDINTQRGKTFLESVGPRIWCPDIYCFLGSCYNLETLYAGTGQTTTERGLQRSFEKAYVDLLEKTKFLADSSGTDWWLIPQLFQGKEKGDSLCSDWRWRWPTPSELSCETFIGLSYAPSGLLYFKHGWWWDSANQEGMCGLYDTTGALNQGLYYMLKDHMVPYIKAIDSTYLNTSWRKAYAVYKDSISLPQNSFVSSVGAIVHPDSVNLNPDAGWFHVGEFTEGSAKYIMLVNRACSQGENNPTAAPSVTATVRFDPSALGLGNYVYIIDIATGTCDTNWVGIPDTTYSAILDGTIPFTTVLGPGEGRLYKIVGTRKNSLTFYNDGLYLGQGY